MSSHPQNGHSVSYPLAQATNYESEPLVHHWLNAADLKVYSEINGREKEYLDMSPESEMCEFYSRLGRVMRNEAMKLALVSNVI